MEIHTAINFFTFNNKNIYASLRPAGKISSCRYVVNSANRGLKLAETIKHMDDILDQFEREEERSACRRLFVGPNADYYLEQWRRMEEGQLLSFNVAAFAFGIFWLLYRQMLRPTLLYFAVYAGELFLEQLIVRGMGWKPLPLAWTFGRFFLFAVLLGLLGNWLYRLHTDEQIGRIRSRYEAPQQARMLQLKGGTSLIPIVLFICLILIILLSNQLLRHQIGLE